MDQEEAKRKTIAGVGEYLGEEFPGAQVVSPTTLFPLATFEVWGDSLMTLSVTPTLLAVITARGGYLDKDYARKYMEQRNVASRMRAGEKVVIYEAD